MVKYFNIRVYGLVLNHLNELLISVENYQNKKLIKFIGGGLEKGEGIKDALIREFQEEIGEEIEVEGLFYVNDFFQQSAFIKEDQIISLFYWIKPNDFESLNNKVLESGNNQKLEWKNLEEIDSDFFTFDIENLVLDKIKKEHKKSPTLQ